MENKIFTAIIFISLIYVFLVLYFRGWKWKSVVIKNEVNQIFGKKDAITGNAISYPNKLVVNLLYNDKEDLNLDLFTDLSIRYDELVDGTYKVPDHIKNRNKKDAIKANDVNNAAKEKKEEPKLKINDVQFESLVDMSQKKSKSN